MDNPSSERGHGDYMKYVSLRLRHHCQFLTLAVFAKETIFWAGLMKTKETVINAES